MELEFDVNMSTGKLYDYSLYHTYRGISGILGTAIGVLLLANYFSSKNMLYLIFGLITVFYLPVALYINAKKQMLLVPAFKEALHYKMMEDGIEVSQGEIVQKQEWSVIHKVVSTKTSIIIYTGKAVASILPRDDMGSQTEAVIKMISTHVEPRKVKIRF